MCEWYRKYKGLALEPGLKDQWRDIEANYILAADEMQKNPQFLTIFPQL